MDVSEVFPVQMKPGEMEKINTSGPMQLYFLFDSWNEQ